MPKDGTLTLSDVGSDAGDRLRAMGAPRVLRGRHAHQEAHDEADRPLAGAGRLPQGAVREPL